MKVSRMIAIILSIAVLSSLVACNNGTVPSSSTASSSSSKSVPTSDNIFDNGPTVKFVIASSASSTSLTYEKMKLMAENIKTASKGKILVDVVWDGILGGDRELMEGCIAGNISAVSMASSSQLTFVPEVAVFDMPMLFDSKEQSVEVFKALKTTFDTIYNKYGLELLSLSASSFREMTCNKNITKIEDFKGIKIRTIENKYHMQFWSNLGSLPTPLPFSELYIALQQGLVEAQENPITGIQASKLYEVQDYLIYTHHILFASTILMNKEFYDTLNNEYKAVIQKEVDSYIAWSMSSQEDVNADAITAMRTVIKTVEISNTLKAQMRKAAEPVYDSIRAEIGTEMVDKMLAAAQLANKIK